MGFYCTDVTQQTLLTSSMGIPNISKVLGCNIFWWKLSIKSEFCKGNCRNLIILKYVRAIEDSHTYANNHQNKCIDTMHSFYLQKYLKLIEWFDICRLCVTRITKLNCNFWRTNLRNCSVRVHCDDLSLYCDVTMVTSYRSF